MHTGLCVDTYQAKSLISFCFLLGSPILALTGTADRQTQNVIIKELQMKEVRKVHVSPNRPNLCISVVKCKREDMFNHLEWLVDVIMKKGTKTPKTIIFCNGTLTDIGAVFNYLLLRLGGAAYSPDDIQASDQCLIGIYHSLTLKKYKERVVESFKNDGKKRVVIASSALSMGVNFPDVRYIIHWGPARNLLDYHQESGRGGRDGKPTHILSIYHGQQLAFCEEDVKTFLKTDGCLRVEAYKPFDSQITSSKPAHDCCGNCAKNCHCSQGGCTVKGPVFGSEPVVHLSQPTLTRPVSPGDKHDLREALSEVVHGLIQTMNLLSDNIDPEYAEQIVDVLVENAHVIFTVMDVTDHIPLFALQHALKILEVFHEMFEDIPNIELMVELFGRDNPNSLLLPQPLEFDFLMQSDSDSSVDIEEEFI